MSLNKDDLTAELNAVQSLLYEIWGEYKVPYLNGDIEGNRDLLAAADAIDSMKGKDPSYSEIAKVRGDFVYQLLKKENDIDEKTARELATKENMNELLRVWTQSAGQ